MFLLELTRAHTRAHTRTHTPHTHIQNPHTCIHTPARTHAPHTPTHIHTLTRTYTGTHAFMFDHLHWLPLIARIQLNVLTMIHRSHNNRSSSQVFT